MTCAAKSPTVPSTNEAAADTPMSHQILSGNHTEATTMSFTASIAEAQTATPPPRLLDSDPNKFRSLKQVIVIGRPGSGTDGIADALKKLGFKVYDFQAANNRYKRDFPLWLEAARLRSEGQPYNQSDYDKLIGDYNALVGAPTCFFDHEFVKLYPNVKVILVTRLPEANNTTTLLKEATSRFWQLIDPTYHGTMSQFLTHTCGVDHAGVDYQLIRKTVREKNLLEVHNLIAWIPLCDFLGLPVPDESAPDLHDDTTKAELAARPQRVISEQAKKISRCMVTLLTIVSKMALITMIAILAVTLGTQVFFKISSVGLKSGLLLAERSQVRDVSRLSAGVTALITLICGFVAGYSLAPTDNNLPLTTDALPRRENQRKFRNVRQRGKQERDRQPREYENTRPDRPTLPAWSSVQDDIRRDDAELLKEAKEGQGTCDGRKNRKHVTFNVKHRLTESGHHVFSGPRKVLSVTEEKIE